MERGGIEMDEFQQKLTAFFADFGKGRKMVLSTSENDKVSSRMMSVIQIDGKLYFQTDRTMKKYHQIRKNNNVALCIDNIQMEGKCIEAGHPLDNAAFCDIFRECFQGAYDAYSALSNERLFIVQPCYIERWIYQDGVPYVETFDMNTQQYSFDRYLGV